MSTNKVKGNKKIIDDDRLWIEKPSIEEGGKINGKEITRQPERATRVRYLVQRFNA